MVPALVGFRYDHAYYQSNKLVLEDLIATPIRLEKGTLSYFKELVSKLGCPIKNESASGGDTVP
jgi:hypothetical protein